VREGQGHQEGHRRECNLPGWIQEEVKTLKIKHLVAGTLALILVAFPISASAVDVFYGDDSAPEGKYGLVWVEDQLRGNPVSYMSSGRDKLCMSADDKTCRDSGEGWQAYVILPPCSSTRLESCIESMGVSLPQSGAALEPLVAGRIIRSISGNNLQGSPALGIPDSGTVSVWDVPGVKHTGDNSNYSVAVRLLYTGVGSQIRGTKIEAAIVPVVERAGNGNRMEMKVVETSWGRGLVHNWHVGNCVWQEQGNCAVAQFWPEGMTAALKVRVPEGISGWLYGRLMNPEVDVATVSSSKTANSVKTIQVTGAPVTVEGSKPVVDCLTMPAAVEAITGKCITQGGRLGGYVSQIPTDMGAESNRWFNAFFPSTGDKADGLVDYWNFKSIPSYESSSSASRCLNSSESLVGIVSSNSLVYSGQPPTFSDGEFKYNVRALHYMPDGTTAFQGTYDLNIRSTAARCLYGLGTTPVSASVSVTSSDGQTQVATSFFNEKNGWMHFGAYGFTFSSPTVAVKLLQGSGGSATTGDFKTPRLNNGTGTYKPIASKPVVVAPAPAKKTTITCVSTKNKKLTKKVTAVGPKCPAGYKKKP
jgi:hypothetical protein